MEERVDEYYPRIASGHMRGLSGWYEGVEFDFMKEANHTITIGTIKEAIDDLQNGTMHNLDKLIRNNCVITYRQEDKKYLLTSHSVTEILLKEENTDKELIRLSEGENYVAEANTLLYFGDKSNCIRLE